MAVGNVSRRSLFRIGGSVLALSALSAFGVTLNPIEAEALSLTVEDYAFTSVPLSTIDMRANKLAGHKAKSVKCTGDLSWVRGNYHSLANGETDDMYVLVHTYKGRSAYNVSGTATFFWENVAIDADGDACDVECVLSNIRCSAASDAATAVAGKVYMAYAKLELSSQFALSSYCTGNASMQVPGVRERVRVRIFKHGTRTLANGRLWLYVNDIDMKYPQNLSHAEGMTFVSGFESLLYVDPNTKLDIDAAAGKVAAGVVQENDPNTSRTSFYIEAHPDFTLEWQGYHCGTNIFNSTRVVNHVDVPVRKVWAGDGNQWHRPAELTVTLKGSKGTTRTAVLNESNGWKSTFDYVPVDETYTISEPNLGERWVGEVKGTANATGYTLTNTYELPMTTIGVEKAWVGDNVEHWVPTSVTCTLTGSDGSERELVLTAADGWRLSLPDMPLEDVSTGQTIDYALAEEPVYGFNSVVTGDALSGFKVTNTLTVGIGGSSKEPVSPTWL